MEEQEGETTQHVPKALHAGCGDHKPKGQEKLKKTPAASIEAKAVKKPRLMRGGTSSNSTVAASSARQSQTCNNNYAKAQSGEGGNMNVGAESAKGSAGSRKKLPPGAAPGEASR